MSVLEEAFAPDRHLKASFAVVTTNGVGTEQRSGVFAEPSAGGDLKIPAAAIRAPVRHVLLYITLGCPHTTYLGTDFNKIPIDTLGLYLVGFGQPGVSTAADRLTLGPFR